MNMDMSQINMDFIINMNNNMMNMNLNIMNMSNILINMNKNMTNMMKMMNNMMNMMNNMYPNNQMMVNFNDQNSFIDLYNFDEQNAKQLKIENYRDIKFKEYYEKIKNHKDELQVNKDKHKHKIIINFYNELKKEIYLDLNDKMRDLYEYILDSIGLWNNVEYYNIYKRQNENQTTKNVIENPIIKKYLLGAPNILLVLKYKNKEIKYQDEDLKFSGIQFGLKDGDEIFIELSQPYIETYALIEDFHIIFRESSNYEKCVIIVSKKNDLLSDVIKEYREKANDKRDNITFIFNGKSADGNLKSQIQELGIEDNYSIQIIPTNLIGGGGNFGMIDFVDVSSKKVKYVSETIFNWREFPSHLNIFGICNNSKCEDFKKEVVHQVYFDEGKKIKFDLKEKKFDIKCPKCCKIIKTITCGFWECEYQFSGKLFEEGNIKNYESEPKETKNKEIEYFDPDKNGEKEWAELIIYILPKQNIKYKKN